MTSQVYIEYGAHTDCPDLKTIKKWVDATLPHLSHYSVAIKIVDETEMTQLNHHYRKKNQPTNVLSFPCLLPPTLRTNHLGDIAICAAVLKKEAQIQQKSLPAHWAHMVVHGVLHLIGYDHISDQEALIMETLEKKILHNLGFPNPYEVETIHD